MIKIKIDVDTVLLLKHVLYINYLICFKKDQAKNQALLDLSSKVNIIFLAYIVILNLKIRPINIKV